MSSVSPQRTCSVEGCGNPCHGYGYCARHYQRWYNGHDPAAASIRDLSVEERFWSRVDKSDPHGCWLWTGALTADGYGTVRGLKGTTVRTHRFAYARYRGAIPRGIHVLHACDVRACVNPAHLWLGTNGDNTADRDAKGRAAIGSVCGNAKLTEQQIPVIRALYASGAYTQVALAARYGIVPSTLRAIIARKTWRHV